MGKHYDPTVAGESIIYTIELADGTIDERKYVDVTRDDILMPRKTMSFLVPREDFPKGSKIYVEFAFPWDYVPPQENIGDQTVHRAYFRAADLPPWPQSGNASGISGNGFKKIMTMKDLGVEPLWKTQLLCGF